MNKTSTALIAVLVLSALGLSACSTTAKSQEQHSCYIRANAEETGEPLLPGTSESGNNLRVMKMLYSGLVYIDKDNKLQNDLAKEIKQVKSTLYQVILKPNLEFSDGSPITAESFVDAWNYQVSEEDPNSSMFSPIAGFMDDKENSTPLSGLKILNPTTFTIELSTPLSDFLMRLSHPTFSPLPKAAFTAPEGIKAYAKHPISSGPYVLESWVANQSMRLAKNPKYQGPRAAANDGVDFIMYTRGIKPYEDLLSGKLDVTDTFSPTGYQNYRTDLPGRYIARPSSSLIELSIHAETPHFEGEEGVMRRQALSMAIDRKYLGEKVLGGAYVPATGFVPAEIPGGEVAAKDRETLTYNPKKAKELWQQADSIYGAFKGPVPVHFSFDISDNHKWGPAVAEQLRKNLGLDSVPVSGADFVRFRYDFQHVRFDGMYRTGWQADYPSLRSYLETNYATNGASNDTKYSNNKVDELFEQADAAKTPAEATKYYQQAQTLLLEQLPAIPLLSPVETVGWNANVSHVDIDFDTYPNYSMIMKNGPGCQP
ncbi:MAG: ABC transporter substrate-binding protein [Corynebacterium sp.]|nr:ABC transporter substrate-binding protein [Corynebacterium sp.]